MVEISEEKKVHFEEPPGKEAGPKDVQNEDSNEQEKVLTPEQQLRFLMATVQILIKNNNALVEQLKAANDDLDHLYSKVGHTRPEKKEEDKKEEGATGTEPKK